MCSGKMEDLLSKIAECVEIGKINQASPYPPKMKGMPGAEELTLQALQDGIPPSDVLSKGLIVGMERIGVRFKANQVFVPQVLMSAKAMSMAMRHLKPFLNDGSVQSRGKFIIGTVAGDLHDIGKNLVSMMVEGNGYEVIDLGVDVKTERFLEAVGQNPGAYVGMSALLTTTMTNMEQTNAAIKRQYPGVVTFIGGAPVTEEFARKIGADYYTDGPQELVEILNKISA